jgi:hypothetical protein
VHAESSQCPKTVLSHGLVVVLLEQPDQRRDGVRYRGLPDLSKGERGGGSGPKRRIVEERNECRYSLDASGPTVPNATADQKRAVGLP